MNLKTLFGIAAIILSSSVLVNSLQSAQAVPSGPNVSHGSNPAFTYYESNWSRFDTTEHSINLGLNAGENVVITNVSILPSGDCRFKVDGIRVAQENVEQLKVDSSTVLSIASRYNQTSSYCGSQGVAALDNRIYIEGYYVH